MYQIQTYLSTLDRLDRSLADFTIAYLVTESIFTWPLMKS